MCRVVLIGFAAAALAVNGLAANAQDCATAKERVTSARALVAKARGDVTRAEAALTRCEKQKQAGKVISCDGMRAVFTGAKESVAVAQDQLKDEEKNQKRQCK